MSERSQSVDEIIARSKERQASRRLHATFDAMGSVKHVVELIITNSRWLLVPFYVGLIAAQCVYCAKFCVNLFEFCRAFRTMDESQAMMGVLILIDITMVANLIKMITVGSYQSFVEKIQNDHTEKVGSGLLKVKMGMSLVGISSIHLLQSFINPNKETTYELVVKASIHVIFLISTIGLAYIDYLHQKSPDEKHS